MNKKINQKEKREINKETKQENFTNLEKFSLVFASFLLITISFLIILYPTILTAPEATLCRIKTEFFSPEYKSFFGTVASLAIVLIGVLFLAFGDKGKDSTTTVDYMTSTEKTGNDFWTEFFAHLVLFGWKKTKK